MVAESHVNMGKGLTIPFAYFPPSPPEKKKTFSILIWARWRQEASCGFSAAQEQSCVHGPSICCVFLLVAPSLVVVTVWFTHLFSPGVLAVQPAVGVNYHFNQWGTKEE
ncbi:hypothetical protein, unlikely [Trypanosoma brucei gambiense DAL972]|uniref:Uncharacterized protein n=1 Tax=Trypanosoma brucei gambiense (strain MHOM/CI/86/DAL972) TaxID=679716 RepID=C9ZL43_TRYB9|nr:hypothetical protein, unlikely [Trypanosoma brucei gambiense DAL972]CBH10052.1 hypothetical protein, unlikely [Trypanosoma brucei gambiense DAL972]|eukprot:XP_011772342.1 hypothetical protein, unlikely [Trypanosoma brucei gambiense DAL972]